MYSFPLSFPVSNLLVLQLVEATYVNRRFPRFRCLALNTSAAIGSWIITGPPGWDAGLGFFHACLISFLFCKSSGVPTCPIVPTLMYCTIVKVISRLVKTCIVVSRLASFCVSDRIDLTLTLGAKGLLIPMPSRMGYGCFPLHHFDRLVTVPLGLDGSFPKGLVGKCTIVGL